MRRETLGTQSRQMKVAFPLSWRRSSSDLHDILGPDALSGVLPPFAAAPAYAPGNPGHPIEADEGRFPLVLAPELLERGVPVLDVPHDEHVRRLAESRLHRHAVSLFRMHEVSDRRKILHHPLVAAEQEARPLGIPLVAFDHFPEEIDPGRLSLDFVPERVGLFLEG